MKIVVLASGSDGNSVYIEIGNTKMLFDVGRSYKYIASSLEKINVEPNQIDYIFITHDHKDHVSALKTFLKRNSATLCITQKVFYELHDIKDIETIKIYEKEIELNNIVVKAINSSHDAEGSLNFVISYNDKKLSLITDTGYIKQVNFKHFYNSNIFLMESNHDIEMLDKSHYPHYLKKRILSDVGHLSNIQAGFYLSKLIGPNTKKIMLIHLSDNSNTPEKALETVYEKLFENDIKFSNILVAKPDEISEVIKID